MTYAQQLRDPRWQRRRLEVMQEHKFTCEECGMNDRELGELGVQLSVHHVYYLSGKNLWEYPHCLLMCLCIPCHIERQEVEVDIYVNVATQLRQLKLAELKEQPIYAFFTEELRCRKDF